MIRWALMLVTLAALGYTAERPYIAVVLKPGGAVGFFSEEGKQLAIVPVGNFPHEAVLSKDGRYLYVSVNGVLWMTEDSEGANRIAIVDVRAMKKTGEIDLGRFHRPHGLAFVPGSDLLLATTERPFGLVMVDTRTRKVVRDFDVKGKSPHMVMPARDGQRAFVSDTDSDVVAVVSLKNGETKLIKTAAKPQGGVFSADGTRLFVTCNDGNQIAVIDTRALKVASTIATGKGPARIAITPDGRELVYNLGFNPGVGFADIASGKQVASVGLSGRPLSLNMTRDGHRVFAGIQDQDKVVFISVRDRKIERVVPVPKGSGPDPVIPLEP